MLGKGAFLALILAFAAYFYFNGYFKVSKPVSPVVETASGSVQGIISVSREGRQFYEYLGIPYAQPPINELRFEPPEPPSSWKGIKEANKYGAECAQFNRLIGGIIMGNEDCLFVNVFTPELLNGGRLLPTIVFTHGGLFISGSGNMYRPEFFMDEDVVLVTLNYRLAALGFLNTGDGVVLGNMGLKDQTMGLRWVQQNINKFGGDPNQVTIFGESAGGASVHLQTMSDMSKGLFQRAISQSGTALNPWTIRSNELAQAQRYAKIVKCPTENTKEMVKCLKHKQVNELLEAHRETADPLRDPITIFGPTIEIEDPKSFLTKHPRDILRSGKVHKIPWMTGYNSHEGLLSSPAIVQEDNLLRAFEQTFNDVMPNYIFYEAEEGKPANNVKSEMSRIRDFYFGKSERIDTMTKMENYTNLFTDYLWGVSLQESVKLQSEFSQVYTYYYTYKGRFTLSHFLMALKGKYPAIVELSWFFISKWVNEKVFNVHLPHYGPCHGDEMALQFPLTGLSDVRQGHPDYELSRKMVKLWTSFASNETPLKFMDNVWKPQGPNLKGITYLKIDLNSDIIGQPDMERMAFWNNLRSKSND